MKKLIVMVPVMAAILLGTTMAFAQASGSYLLPYGMSAGMSVLNRALQPRPAAAPTPAESAGGYAQVGDRRLVCEQWNGTRWVVIPVNAKQCNP